MLVHLQNAFGVAVSSARSRSLVIKETENLALHKYKRVLDQIGDTGGCGACWMLSPGTVASHTPMKCPKIREEPLFESLFFQMKRAFNYIGDANVCYRCHICAMGGDALHPAFGKALKSCTHPNLMAPLIWAVFVTPELKNRAMTAFGLAADAWSTMRQMQDWCCAVHPTHHRNVMQLLVWAGIQVLGD
jgi:hypothetical protein